MTRRDDTSALSRGRRRLLDLQMHPDYQHIRNMEAALDGSDEFDARDTLRWALATLVQQHATLIAALRHLSAEQRQTVQRFATDLLLEPRLYRPPPRRTAARQPKLRLIRGGKAR